MSEGEKRALVLGRQIFVDLWALEGFEKIVCEEPSSFGDIIKDVLGKDIGLILMEESWLDVLPGVIRHKLESLQEPAIVVFPSITNLLM